FGAQDEAEFVDAADGVAPRDADERLGWHSPAVLRAPHSVLAGGIELSPTTAGGEVVRACLAAAVLVAEVDPDRPGRLDAAHPLPCCCHQRVHELCRGSLSADLPVVMLAAVLVGPQAEVGRAGHDEIDTVVWQVEVERVTLQDGHARFGHIWSIHVDSLRLAHEVEFGFSRTFDTSGMVGS